MRLPELPGVEHRFVDAGGLRTHIAEAGEGEPLVLVHGWPQNWYAWHRVLPALCERFRVICPDLRGHGWTAAPPGPYDKPTLASDLLALLDALGLERVRLAGHDWGGFAGFLLALRAPERVEAFAALGITPPWARARRSPRAPLTLAYQAVLGAPVLGEWTLRVNGAFVKTLVKRGTGVPGTWDGGDLDLYAEQWREPARARAASAIYRTFLLREATSRDFRGAHLVPPTLLLIGDREPLLWAVDIEGWERRAADGRTEWLPGVGHWSLDEAPEAVSERLLDFFGAHA